MRSKLSNVLLAIALALCSAGLFNACSHEHVYANQITEPTCLEQGYTTYTCSCGDSYVADYVNALDHIFTKYVSDKNASCTKDGTKTAHCDRTGCTATDTVTDTGSKLEHEFTNYLSDNNATYKSDGTKTAHCDRTGCTATDTVTDVGSKLQSGISFNTLTVDGESVFGKVSNATETFSFIDEIKTVGEMKFIVSLDIYGTQQVVSKKIPLSIGDNIVYVIELLDNEPKNVYTVNVRRRPMYTVSFNTDGGTAVDNQIIEEDAFATSPTTTLIGYTFDKWDYDFTTPITDNTKITASWTANTDTPYKVEYYLQNLDSNYYYTLETVEEKTGTTDTTAIAEIKTFEHFTVTTERVTGNIAPDGSTVLKVYYTRDKYTVTFDGNGGTLKSGSASQMIKYGGSAVAPTFKRTGYTFDKWNYDFTKPIAQNTTITASWIANKDTPYKVEYYLQNLEDDNYTLNTSGNKTGTTDTTAIAEIKTFEHFTVATERVAGNIAPDGSTVLKVYYTRDKYTVTFDGNGGTLKSGSATQSIKYGGSAIAPTFEKTGYMFNNFDKLLTNVSENITIKAQWITIFTLKGETITGLIDYGKTLTKIEIPSIINGVTIKYIGENAFSGCSNLTSITIPNSVTSIGDSAFYGCYSLTSITVDKDNSNYSSVDGILYNKKQTAIIHIPKAISGSVTIPNGVTSIGHAFYNCSSLTSVTIPDSVTSIGYEAFYNCRNLTSVTIGNGVTSIGSHAFDYCSSLTSVTFANPSNWYVSNYSNATSGTYLTLTNTAQNATYLKDSYCWCYWYKR